MNTYITKDGSLIKEILNPAIGNSKNMSVAEATILKGKQTFLHIHKKSEEVYYILYGKGILTLGDRELYVKSGDVILIPPKTVHNIKNTGDTELKILCICSPPYSHEDTELM